MTGAGITSLAEPLLDLEGLAAGIRWRRRIWRSLALLGLLAGVLLTVAIPPVPTAVTRVLVVRADDQLADRNVLMENDVALCHSSLVAVAALKQIGINEPINTALDKFSCTGVTPNVLEITVKGSSSGDAVRRAGALAQAFIASHIQRTQDAAQAQANALLDQRTRVENTLASISKTIATTADPAQLAGLYNVRATLANQIQDLSQQADQAHLVVPVVTSGTGLVDPARALPSRLLRTGAINIAVGLVLGLGVGLAVSAILAVTRDRPLQRRHIAAELGVSVIAQLPAAPRGPRRLWRHSGHVRDQHRVAATLARVVRSSPTPVSVLESGCPATAAALALDIAEQLATERAVLVLTSLSDRHLSPTHQRSTSRTRIVDIAALRPDAPATAGGSELRLGVGSVGPGTSWTDLSLLGAETLLVVRAGTTTTLGLHTIARQLAHSGIAAIGVVLVAPDPKDRSDGTLWAGLHTVLRRAHAANDGRPAAPEKPAMPAETGRHALEPSSAPHEK